MKSKTYDQEVAAIGTNKFGEILDYIDKKTRTIFLDEVQLMDGNLSILSYLSIAENMDIYLDGLNYNIRTGSISFDATSDKVENIPDSCYTCGRDKIKKLILRIVLNF